MIPQQQQRKHERLCPISVAAAMMFLISLATAPNSSQAFFLPSSEHQQHYETLLTTRPLSVFGMPTHRRSGTQLGYRTEGDVAFATKEGGKQLSSSSSSATTTTTTATVLAPPSPPLQEQKPPPRKVVESMAIPQVTSLNDYMALVAGERERVVVVRFYSTSCQSCNAIKPRYQRIYHKYYPSVKFVDVPISRQNRDIHESFGIKTIPYGQIYYPGQGLVDHGSLNSSMIRFFEQRLKSYVQESCPLPDLNEKTHCFETPYPRVAALA